MLDVLVSTLLLATPVALLLILGVSTDGIHGSDSGVSDREGS